MGIKLAVVGCGQFAEHFIALFKNHPLVDKLVLCDRNQPKLDAYVNKFGDIECTTSFQEVLDSDFDAVALFSQPWLHADMIVDVLDSKKHCWCTVPPAESIDDMQRIVDAVMRNKKFYYIAETSFYTPETVYCRKQYEKGKFGRIVYAECEYYHDMDHGLREVYQQRGGKDWLKVAGVPPMWYPTHSISHVTSITGAYPTHVSCVGYVDDHDDRIYRPNVNQYNNIYSGQTAVYRMSDGSILRHNEMRRFGHIGAIRFSMFGTDGSFENNTGAQMWVNKEKTENVSELVTCDGGKMIDTGAGSQEGYAPIHDTQILPEAFLADDLFKGHSGSHPFLVHDFVTSVYENNPLPNNNIWAAARTMIPGLIAHESCLMGGQLLKVPDLGDPRPLY